MTASHRELALDALERLSAGSGAVAGTVVSSCRPIAGAVVVATCNRFELYLDVDIAPGGPGIEHAAGHITELVAAGSGIDQGVARAALRVRQGHEVTRHLFAVAAGLDSMVVGEREIAGQVKRALVAARAAHTTSKTLELLFQSASRISKQVAADTTLGAAGRSLVGVGLDAAADHLPPWSEVRTVLVGTGSYAGASLAAVRALGCREVRVYSPSGRAEVFAAARDAQVVHDLDEALGDADLVLSCSGAGGTGASSHVLGVESVRARGTSPLVVLDFALHRDVDPAVAQIEGVRLFDLAALGELVPHAGPGVVAHAQGIVDCAAGEFEATRMGRAADADVVALLDAAEERIAAEVAEQLAANGGGDAESITRSVRRRVHTALHPQIVAVRARAVEQARSDR